MNADEYDTSLLKDEVITGYVIDDKKTALNHLKTLAIAFRFDAYLDDGKIFFKSLTNSKTHIVDEDDIIVDENAKKKMFFTENIGENNIPSSVEMLFIDIDKNYNSSTAIAKNAEKTDSIF